MEKIKTINQNPASESEQEEMKLDDARRVKVLSPGMLVFKRFIRNKLAIVGAFILIFMFLFSFLGAAISPYGQKEVFYTEGSMLQEYAGAALNKEFRYTVVDGYSFSNAARAEFAMAKNKGKNSFTSQEQEFSFEKLSENAYRITSLVPIAKVMTKTKRFTPVPGASLPDGIETAFSAAQSAGETSFSFNGNGYVISPIDKLSVYVNESKTVAVASMNIIDAYRASDASLINTIEFRIAVETALAEGKDNFIANGAEYHILGEEGSVTVFSQNNEPFAEVSDIIINAVDLNETLSIDFKAACRDAISEKKTSFIVSSADGIETDYELLRGNNSTYTVKTSKKTTLINMYAAPSKEHWLGLDNNGMDVLTRLMYGGRISLMVGFVVVILETVIGVIIGGISGYFGGAVDTILMRFVDLFNSIPFYPVVIIFGSVMDTLQVKPEYRIFLLMFILGILGWTSDARTVRGQILSLREQDFMVATEATGIRTSRRIFRHLVPNVMPLLIVQATAGLGGIIITEATLGFLGLGVKYPLASWGSIINTASDAYVMTNFWFMWIPAGLLILLTVLGFNFVGDGLRDAYDPKMKR